MDIYVKSGTKIYVGKTGEKNATKINFSIQDWIDEFGESGVAELTISINGITYPKQVSRTGSIVTWVVDDTDTASSGLGKCELSYSIETPTKEGKIVTKVKSETYQIYVTSSLGEGEDTPPAPFQSWIDDILGAVDTVKAAVVAPYIETNGNWYIWDYINGAFIDSGIAAFSPDTVRFDIRQELTEEQKEVARSNIGASSLGELPIASNETLGGIIADPVEETDTQPVRVSPSGRLYTAPSAGGGDWDVNNEDEDGYIKNRPFYAIPTSNYNSFLEPINISDFTLTNNKYIYESVPNILLNTDKNYKVTINGKELELEAFDEVNENIAIVYIGDSYIDITSNNYTSIYGFTIATGVWSTNNGQKMTLQIHIADLNRFYSYFNISSLDQFLASSIEVTFQEVNVKKIHPRFMPYSVAPVSGIADVLAMDFSGYNDGDTIFLVQSLGSFVGTVGEQT